MARAGRTDPRANICAGAGRHTAPDPSDAYADRRAHVDEGAASNADPDPAAAPGNAHLDTAPNQDHTDPISPHTYAHAHLELDTGRGAIEVSPYFLDRTSSPIVGEGWGGGYPIGPFAPNLRCTRAGLGFCPLIPS